MKIEWAPLKVPPTRRLQTLAAGLYVASSFLMPFASLFATALLIIYGPWILKLLTLVYITYIYFDHTRRHSVMDGNGWIFFRKNFIWHHLRDYFPVELVKTVDLKPDRNYILATFPHGIVGTGVSVNMGNDIRKWLELFPGIRPKLGTLDQQFMTPFMREVLRLWGLVSVSKESLTYYLSKPNDPKHPDIYFDGYTSNAVAILVGGAEEALDAHPGRYIFTLKRRKGFVKLAIRTGSSIVPSISFGEVDIFDQVNNPPDSWLRRFQSVTKKLTGIAPVMVLGRGFFQYSFGFLPQRRHIVQVVGAPIDVKKNDNPDQAYIDEIHQKVINAVDELFEKYKAKYIQHSENVKLIIQ